MYLWNPLQEALPMGVWVGASIEAQLFDWQAFSGGIDGDFSIDMDCGLAEDSVCIGDVGFVPR